MKYLKEELDINASIKKFKNWIKYKDIHDICKKYGIKDYHINDDGTVDVYEDVFLSNKKLNKIPLKFGNVSGYFNCEGNNLTNLIGCPSRVEGDFLCSHNYNLTSLEGCPTYIGAYFHCYYNKNLWSMDYFPRHAKRVGLDGTPIEPIFDLFRNEYLSDGGKNFSTSGTLIDFFWDCDPIRLGNGLTHGYGGIIIRKRMDMFLSSIGKKLDDYQYSQWVLRSMDWKIQ